MTARGPIASLPLVAEPHTSSFDQSLIQSARFNSPDVFPTGNLFRGAVTLTESARLPSAIQFRVGAIIQIGVPRTLTQSARVPSSNVFPNGTASVIGPQTITQAARLASTNAFPAALIKNINRVFTQSAPLVSPNTFFVGAIGLVPVMPDGIHPPILVGFPPDGSGATKKKKPNVRIKWRDTVAEAEARLLEEQRLAEMAQLAAFEAYLIKRRKIAAATALLMS